MPNDEYLSFSSEIELSEAITKFFVDNTVEQTQSEVFRAEIRSNKIDFVLLLKQMATSGFQPHCNTETTVSQGIKNLYPEVIKWLTEYEVPFVISQDDSKNEIDSHMTNIFLVKQSSNIESSRFNHHRINYQFANS